jgi:DNA replication protein DnaC
LDSPLWRDRVRFAQLRALATQWTPSAGSVLISAPSRAGKTAGCVALVHRLIAEATATADPAHIATSTAWISGLALADEWRRTAYGTRSGLIEHAARVRLLVLDELGQEDARPAWLLEVLDQRYVRALPTLSTTGLRIGELTARYGSGAVARLVEPVGATVEVWGG